MLLINLILFLTSILSDTNGLGGNTNPNPSGSENSSQSEFDWKDLIDWSSFPPSHDEKKSEKSDIPSNESRPLRSKHLSIRSGDQKPTKSETDKARSLQYYSTMRNDSKKWQRNLALRRARYRRVKEERMRKLACLNQKEKEIILDQKKRKNQQLYQKYKANRKKEGKPTISKYIPSKHLNEEELRLRREDSRLRKRKYRLKKKEQGKNRKSNSHDDTFQK